MLQDLVWLLRSLHDRVAALEERVPTWASGNLPHADVAARLDRAAAAIAAINGNEEASPADPGERDPPLAGVRQTIKKRPPPGNAPPMVQGGALRAAIAGILEAEPEATGPRVIEALRATHTGKLPSPRTVRWHLAALRGNGNAE
jgi:hypothetical protein